MSARNGKYRSFVTPVLPPCFVSSVAKSALPRLSNPQPPRYLDRADTHLGISCREPGVDQLGDLLSREAARKHDRFGAAVWAGGEQFKRSPAVGLGASPGAFCWLLRVRGPQRRHSVLTKVDQGVFPFRPLPSTACLAYRGERGKRTLNLAVGSSIRRRIPGRDPQANPAGTFSAEAPGLSSDKTGLA